MSRRYITVSFDVISTTRRINIIFQRVGFREKRKGNVKIVSLTRFAGESDQRQFSNFAKCLFEINFLDNLILIVE